MSADYCKFEPRANPVRHPGDTHCEKRFVSHHWHVVDGKELPVCCFCNEPAILPKHSCYLELWEFSAYQRIIERNGRNMKAAPIGGFSMIYHEPQRSRESIETVDVQSGIIRIYGHGCPLADHIRMYRIVERNIENLQSGKIKEQYRAEALKEIEEQLSYLPKHDTESVKKPNRENQALANRFAGLKGSLIRKLLPGKAKKSPVVKKQSKGKK